MADNGSEDPLSFEAAIERAKNKLGQPEKHKEVVKADIVRLEAKLDAIKPPTSLPIPARPEPSDGHIQIATYAAAVGAWKMTLPILSGAGAVAAIAVIDYALSTDYLSGKMSPIVVIGVTAAARFVQNYLKESRKLLNQKE